MGRWIQLVGETGAKRSGADADLFSRMRKWFHNPQRAAGAALLTFSLAVLWVNGGESFRPKTAFDDGFPLTAATPAKGASWETTADRSKMEDEFATFAEDLPSQPAPVAFVVTDTLTVAAGGFAIVGLSLLRRKRPETR